ncbi:hypothetical protein OpiT1DRAFT_01538 [Opitutaceae bacterium TAV1]|nr:hypothetical protein OpiT1DRAFT_01538 [Opitutaceae bacterium TAV1]
MDDPILSQKTPYESSSLRLCVSRNGRFLVQAEAEPGAAEDQECGSADASLAGEQPFFWLGDTAWELFHRLDREEADHYLETRAAQGFTVIQAVGLAELDGLGTPNPYGHRPLVDDDPACPDPRYWEHVDHVVQKANALGLVIGFLPTWGCYWHAGAGTAGTGKVIFTPENAGVFGEWLGRRYRDARLVWIPGGDRPVETDTHRSIIRSMAAGLRRGDGGAHLMTFHPQGGAGSAQYFHDEPWLDFNLRQNGHGVDFSGYCDRTAADYARIPAKPVIDGEPVYEDIPVNFDTARHGFATALDTRRALYRDLFSGACGHTYGHNAVWQMWDPDAVPARAGLLSPRMSWREALHAPGALQMRHARRLMALCPFITRGVPLRLPFVSGYPGQAEKTDSSCPDFVAMRDVGGRWMLVYVPASRPFHIPVDAMPGWPEDSAAGVDAGWFDPRTGEVRKSLPGEAGGASGQVFVPPASGEDEDWVLIFGEACPDCRRPSVF